MVQKVCRYCGQFFNIKIGALNKGEGQYCSRACWMATRTKLLECPTCHKHIVVGIASKQQFCSRPCRDEWRRQHTKLVKRVCALCGREFMYQRGYLERAKYCSKVCFLKVWYKYVPRQCEHCGKTYKPDHEGQRFCSIKCKGKAQRDPSLTRRCKACRKVYRTTDASSKYCSRGCYYASNSGESHHRWNGGELYWSYPTMKKPSKVGAPRRRRPHIHTAVMEAYLGRPLDFYGPGNGKNEVVHHLDGNRKNFKIWNLELCLAREHMRYHANEAVRRKKTLRG